MDNECKEDAENGTSALSFSLPYDASNVALGAALTRLDQMDTRNS
jgi:hypothetical protein